MAGVEIALAANDVCGAPVPAPMCCPWLFFDGKLFHFKLLKANNNTPLIDMCDGQVSHYFMVFTMLWNKSLATNKCVALLISSRVIW